MKKLQVLGQSGLTDCSDVSIIFQVYGWVSSTLLILQVIPVPASLPGPIAYPASFSEKDVLHAVRSLTFNSQHHFASD